MMELTENRKVIVLERCKVCGKPTKIYQPILGRKVGVRCDCYSKKMSEGDMR